MVNFSTITEHATSLVDDLPLAILANGGEEFREDLCKCDQDVGMCPCEYCAIFGMLLRTGELLMDTDIVKPAPLRRKTMIHVTFCNGETALFYSNEYVWVCKDIINGEYIAGDHVVQGSDLEPGLYVLRGDEIEPEVVINSPIQRVTIIKQLPAFLKP